MQSFIFVLFSICPPFSTAPLGPPKKHCRSNIHNNGNVRAGDRFLFQLPDRRDATLLSRNSGAIEIRRPAEWLVWFLSAIRTVIAVFGVSGSNWLIDFKADEVSLESVKRLWCLYLQLRASICLNVSTVQGKGLVYYLIETFRIS